MKKAIQIIVVVVILAMSYATYFFVQPESWMQNKQTVSAADIAAQPIASYEGKLPGEGITPLQSAEEFHALKTYDFVAVSPQNVVGTGVYELKRWVNPNDLKKSANQGGRTGTSGRSVPNIVTNAVQAVENYNQYYLISLPDDSYILALFDHSYMSSIKSGETITLPIGRRLQTVTDALVPLRTVCEKYNADSSNTLYMFDNGWQKSNQNSIFWTKFGIAAGVFILLTIIAAVVLGKVFEVEHETQA